MFQISEKVVKDRYEGLLQILADNYASSVSKEWFKLRKEKAEVYAELIGRSLTQDLSMRLNG